MRHSALVAPIALSLVALVAACATAATDPLDEHAQEQNGTQPPDHNDGAKLPPPSSPPQDSGTKQDSGGSTPSSSGSTSSSSGSTSSSSGSTSSSSSSGSTSSSSSGGSTSSSGGAGAACDVSTPEKALVYQFKLAQESSPVPCPCPATKCCYLNVACLTP